VALLFQGYAFGGGDQIEILPVFNYWNDTSLYSHDFYIQSFLSKAYTERSPFLYVVYFLTQGKPWLIFFLHVVTSLVLFAGLIRIGEIISGSAIIGTLAALLVVTLGSQFSLGGNELYYNLLIPSLLSKAIAVWCIYYWLIKNGWFSIFLLICSTYIHPLVGLQIFVLMVFANLWLKREFWTVILQAIFYLAIISPWILTLYLQQSQGSLDHNLYLEILEFRVAHHFLPQYFGYGNFLITSILALVAVYWYRISSRETLALLIPIILGCLVYSVFVTVFSSKLFLNTQWFKSTIWLEFFSFLAFLDIIRSTLNWDTSSRMWQWTVTGIVPVACLIFLVFGIKNPLFSFPWISQDTDEIEISLWVKENTDSSALFLTPPHYTSFKYVSQRASWIDYKAMIHHHDVMNKWYDRVKLAYSVDIKNRKYGSLRSALKAWPGSVNASFFENIRQLGITHVIVPAKNIVLDDSIEELYRSNDDHIVIQLSD
jgi:hypothetical protein